MPPDQLPISLGFLEEHAARRRAVLDSIGPSVVVVGAQPVYPRNADTEHPYRQDSDFFYLTGLDEPECVAILTNVHEEHRFVLFVRPRDPERETWDGPRAGVDGAKLRFGADAAFPIAELAEKLPGYLTNAHRLVYGLGRDAAMDARVLSALHTVRRRQRAGVLPPHEIVDPAIVLHELRLVKSPAEIAIMRRAIEATRESHLAAMRVAKPGAYEHDVEAEMLRVWRRHGAERPAYEPIVGSGPNATILHYRKNDRRLEEGDLLLIDAGAEVGYFASDVTRTFPVSGKFTAAQRAVYEVVLAAQERCIAAVAPGVTIEALHQLAVRAITEGLVALGLIEGPVDEAIEKERYKAYYMHRTSHWLGMDVHDVGLYFERDGKGTKPRAMKAGCVITVEPGVYIPVGDEKVPAEYRGIGVRIEDDVLVTETGYDVLTRAIPKRADELEAILATR